MCNSGQRCPNTSRESAKVAKSVQKSGIPHFYVLLLLFALSDGIGKRLFPEPCSGPDSNPREEESNSEAGVSEGQLLAQTVILSGWEQGCRANSIKVIRR